MNQHMLGFRRGWWCLPALPTEPLSLFLVSHLLSSVRVRAVSCGFLNLQAVPRVALQQRGEATQSLLDVSMAWSGMGQGGPCPLVACEEILVQTGLAPTELIDL